MKKTYLAVGMAAIGVVAVAMFLRDGADTPPETSSVVEQNAVEPSGSPATGVAVEQAADSPVEQTADSNERPETEVVMGITVLRDRNCTVTRHYVDLGNGMVTEAYSCVPNETAPEEYDHYSNEELAVLAYSDATAASMLGRRLVEADSDRSRDMMLRALALEPGNVEPVMWLASQAYSLRGDSAAARDATANAYVITSTARAMGSDADINWIVEDLRAVGFDDERIAALDRSVREDLRAIRNIQLEVFGQSTIGEVQL